MPSTNISGLSAVRARSYLVRLPLFTRGVVAIIIAFWALSLQSLWDVRAWGALIPDTLGLSTGSLTRQPLPSSLDLVCLQTGFCYLLWIITNGSLLSVYRANTFPFIHTNFFHALMNVLALTPLLERFESEYGTLTTLALFLGRGFFLKRPVDERWIDC